MINIAMIHRLRRFPLPELWLYSVGMFSVAGAAVIGSTILPELGTERTSLAQNLARYERLSNATLGINGVSLRSENNIFPVSTDNTVSILGDLHARAARANVMIDLVVWNKTDKIPDANTERTGFVVNARGTYAALKNVIAEFLANNPAVALESMAVRRARSTDLVTDIEIRFGYFYRGQAVEVPADVPIASK